MNFSCGLISLSLNSRCLPEIHMTTSTSDLIKITQTNPAVSRYDYHELNTTMYAEPGSLLPQSRAGQQLSSIKLGWGLPLPCISQGWSGVGYALRPLSTLHDRNTLPSFEEFTALNRIFFFSSIRRIKCFLSQKL